MSDTTDTADSQVGISLAEAAAHLRVSERTILRRIEKGTLKGQKVDAERGQVWRVFVDGMTVVSDTLDKLTSDTTDRRSAPGIVKALEMLEAERDEVKRLQAENEELRDSASHWQARYTQAQDTLQRLLPAPKENPESPAAAAVKRPWWKIWER